MEDIDILIGKKLAGEMTGDEQRFLQNWLAASPENQQRLRQMERLWAGFSPKNSPLPRPIDVESALQKTKARIGSQSQIPEYRIPKARVVGLKNWWLAAAAAVAVAVAAVLFFQKAEVKTTFTIASADQPQRETLADGSKIALNRDSKIKVGFSKKTRRVELAGEAFFEVAHDAARPFTVAVAGLEITAVGTAFDVDATEAGRVAVRMAEGRVRLAAGGQTVFLAAGEAAFFDEKTGLISTSKITSGNSAAAFLDRRFDFDDEPLGEVLPRLERAYGVHISLKNSELRRCRIRSRFDGEPVERVVEVIAETLSLSVERTTGGGFALDGAGCE